MDGIVLTTLLGLLLSLILLRHEMSTADYGWNSLGKRELNCEKSHIHGTNSLICWLG